MSNRRPRRPARPSAGAAAALSRAGVMVLAGLVQACAVYRPPLVPGVTPPYERELLVDGRPLTIHLAEGAPDTVRPLIVYATGDGGWRGKDRSLFGKLVAMGYPVAAFSSPEYIKRLRGEGETTTPAALGRDYAAIIEYASAAMRLPAERPVILVGVSRGAGLAVVAAGQRRLQASLDGVVAIGLTREEEHVHWFGRRPRPPQARPVMVSVYDYLPRLGPLPLAVIQSTHDGFLPAAEARRLFGTDTGTRRLVAVESRNHSFSDARDRMYAAVAGSLDWIRANRK